MAVKIRVVRAAALTSGGPTQDFTHADIGAASTVKAAIFFIAGAATDNSATANARGGYGLTDFTNQYCLAQFGADEIPTTTDSARGFWTDAVIGTCSATARVAHANTPTAITGGVRITWQAFPSAAYMVTCIIISGSGVTAKANAPMTPGTAGAGGAVDVTDVGFLSDFVFMLCANAAGFNPTGGITASLEQSLGVAHQVGGVVRQRSAIHFWAESSPSFSAASLSDTGICQDYSANVITQVVTIKTFDASGWTLEAAGTAINARQTAALSLKFNDEISCYVGDYTSPTTAEDKVISGIGFKPQAGGVIQTQLLDLNLISLTAESGSVNIGAFDATTQSCASMQFEDAATAASADTQSVVDAKVVNQPTHNNGPGLVATRASLDTDGVTLNYSVALASARHGIIFLFGEEAASLVTTRARQVRGTSPTIIPRTGI